MTRALAHRGPDGEGIWHGPGIALGHRRLSILGLGDTGAQPMTRDHLTIVYNGELYNHQDLRRHLAHQYTFTSGTDTEVVLRAWQRWGPDSLHRFRGMYAFAIWDHRTQQLTLSRDHLGIKPLYYHRSATTLSFASEVQALLAAGSIPARPDLHVLHRQLLCSTTLQVDPRRTLMEGVQQLPPATWLTIGPHSGERLSRYWALPAVQAPGRTDASHAEFARLLRDSVTGMLEADVPVSTFLSGGLDSSTITAIASNRTPHQDPLTALTLADHSHGHLAPAIPSQASEDLAYARDVANALPGPVTHRINHTDQRIRLEHIDNVCDLAVLSDDVRHLTIACNYRAVRRLGLTVVLNGQGADEIMGGYVGQPNFINNILDVRAPSPTTIARLPRARRSPLLTPHVLTHQREAEQEVLDLHADLPGTPTERAHRLLVQLQLPRILQFEDFLSMRAGVEARVPFLDHRIVEWCFSQPFENHLDPSQRLGKLALRRLASQLLPARVVNREKQPFPSPSSGTARDQLAAIGEQHHAAISRDPLLQDVFLLPQAGQYRQMSVQALWLLLATWRWNELLMDASRKVEFRALGTLSPSASTLLRPTTGLTPS
jgi:asparagine synthase (glutamine-hydrolysing)